MTNVSDCSLVPLLPPVEAEQKNNHPFLDQRDKAGLQSAKTAMRQRKFDNKKPNAAERRTRKYAQRPTRTAACKKNRPALLIPRPPMDELFAPNLTCEALTTQATESFSGWLVSHFPLMYCSFDDRVDTNWMQFLRNLKPSRFPQALTWAIRALLTFHMGTMQGNINTVYCARHMYGMGIRHLRFLLQTPRALTDEALAAAVLLGGYEVGDGTAKYSWIRQTRGIRHLMQARGPVAHKTGFGRTLLLCFGPFLIAESFILSEPCFLGDHDWICLVEDIYKDRKRVGLGQAMDRAFNEAALCPNYYTTTRSSLAATADPNVLVVQEMLLTQMAKSKARFLELQGILANISEDEKSLALNIGSIPPVQARNLARLTSEGINYSLALLDQLTGLVESDRRRKLSPFTDMDIADPWRTYSQKLIMEKQDCPQPEVGGPTAPTGDLDVVGDRLDRFSLTMGVVSVWGIPPIQIM
ncbi:hypothetical protein BJX63DRAFT_419708 [Aspergillus granulosus]|uniref:Uncharacterized protein n=1 Tax=Aspergillus granulosus TaxID=176169 RepID=A0ABR4HNS8_9EURO